MGIRGVELAQPLSDVLTFCIAIVFFVHFVRDLGRKEREAQLP